MRQRKIGFAILMSAGLMGLAACSSSPTGTAPERALDRAAGTNTSGAYPMQSDGMPGNPPGTAATRAVDRAAGTNTSGAYPSQSDGTRANPPGTAATRAYDRTTGSNTSGAYPQNGPRQ
ncbi:hypothetical protein [Roseomonas sp. USHLN139]|uniref:hypothetical protein n=1 Tax=Roseomonas sp. USHLN139 TaxID=3081298 RepID=UPI003B01100E